MPRKAERNYTVVIGRHSQGVADEETALKQASKLVSDYGGREEVYIYKLHRIVRSKPQPIEIQAVSL